MSVVAGTAVGAAAARRVRLGAIWVAFALLLVVLPHVFTSPVVVALVNKMGIAVIFALSYNMLLGQGGMLSFGHAVYFGLGGFLAIHVLNLVEAGVVTLPVPVLPLVGGLGGLLSGILFGSISTSRAGTVFAMISLGIGELVAASSLIFTGFFGGEEGVTGNRTKAPAFLGLRFLTDQDVYLIVAFWTFVAVALMYAFSRTPAGRMANAVRDNPERAEFVGYSQRWVRFVTFCAAGFFAGIAGGLFAVNYEILTEENLSLVTSGQVLLMTFIGGVGFFVGPLIGAVVFTFLQSMLSDYTRIWLLYVGIIFLAMVMFVPMGFAGLLMIHEPARRRGTLHQLAGPYLAAGLAGLVAAVGAIGLLELVAFQASRSPLVHTRQLFWLTVDVSRPWAWLAFLALLGGGALALRWLGPRVATAYYRATRETEARG
jgi:branched-chain amino acid transport system permease protein